MFIVAVFLGLLFAHLLRENPRPNLFDLLFVLAALVGAMGYALNLFSRVGPYDELTHSFTTFSVSLAFLSALPGRRALRTGRGDGDLGAHAGHHDWRVLGDLRMGHRE